MAEPILALTHYFAKLRDPRLNRRKRHLLPEIIAISICAIICGANNWQQVEAFGQSRQEWLKKFFQLPNGTPSHDTFERVFARLNPRAFARCFAEWTSALQKSLGVKHIAIDGKTMRASGCRASGLGPLHLVSAWAAENHLSLGQVAVEGKSNEIAAIPKLLELLDLKGALVTIDAMGCQKKIAADIVNGDGDYILTVKGNQEHLAEDVQECFNVAMQIEFQGLDWDEWMTEEWEHGRHEKRYYAVIHDPVGIRDKEAWANLCTIGMCCSERTYQGKTTEELRYFISSKRTGARWHGKKVRGHWGIENSLHWVLDVTFREDDSRVRERNAAENFGLLRRMALSMLYRHHGKGSVATKRFKAAMDTDVLEEVLECVILGAL
jgi:predicted transposase YbfD/YdcC